MQLNLLSSVCAVALGLAFAPAAWADDDGTSIDGSAIAVDGSTAAVDNSETENEFEARNSFNSQSADSYSNQETTKVDTSVEDSFNHEVETEELEKEWNGYLNWIRKQSKVIPDSLPYRIMVVNIDRTIETVNQTFLNAYDLTEDMVQGKHCC